MSSLALAGALAPKERVGAAPPIVRVESLGELVAVGRPGGQGRVYRPAFPPAELTGGPSVVKLYRRAPSGAAAALLSEMISWSRGLDPEQRARLYRVAAWPLALVTRGRAPAGIAMHDVGGRFEVPIVMPSGRRDRVLLSLEHLLGSDDYLLQRGLGVRLDTAMRAAVCEEISGALAFVHRHGVVASDIAPNNLLVGFAVGAPTVCFIDCDSMVFHGRQALPQVETGDWQIPPEFSEPPRTRAADAYKLGLVVLRLFARSHDARSLAPYIGSVPEELRAPLMRALAPNPANRPPAGEWQRALRQSLLRGGLAERYPGPVRIRPRPRPAPPPAPRIWEAPPRPRSVTARPARQPQSYRRSRARPLSFVWAALVLVVFTIILLRLFAAIEPSFNSSNFGTGGSGGGGGQIGAPTQYYYAPTSR